MYIFRNYIKSTKKNIYINYEKTLKKISEDSMNTGLSVDSFKIQPAL